MQRGEEVRDFQVYTTQTNSYSNILITAPHEAFHPKRSPNTTFHLNYNFSWETPIHELVSHEHSLSFIGTSRFHATINSFSLVIRGDFETNVGEGLKRELSSIPEIWRDRLIAELINQTKLKIKPWESTGNNCFDFDVHVVPYVTRTRFPYDDDDFIEISPHENDSIELFQSSPRSVPATDQAIESLEHKIVVLPCGLIKAICSVCLEGFPRGSVMAKMPCSHWFHEQCIKTWLKKNNSCPVCRHKLPTI